MNFQEKVEFLSTYYGVIPYYYDIWGNFHKATIDQKINILLCMGVDIQDDSKAETTIATIIENILENPCPPVITLDEGSHIVIPVTSKNKKLFSSFKWLLIEEDGSEHTGYSNVLLTKPSEKITIGKTEFNISSHIVSVFPKPGYHKLYIEFPNGRKFSVSVIVSPEKAHQALCGSWGISTQLYGIRSRNNLGLGDFGDLEALLRISSFMGARFIGLNPLFCLYTENPEHISPYSPSSRRFLNPWYINIQKVPEYRNSYVEKDKTLIEELRKTHLVDYARAVSLKNRILKGIFKGFLKKGRASHRWKLFEKFCSEEGRVLDAFARFEATRLTLNAPWFLWPSELNEPIFQEEILFHKFLQFVAEEQLSKAVELGKGLQPPVSLYLDFPIGVDAGGFDTWFDSGLYSLDVELGAPPDDFNPSGQKWGIVPFIPHRLKARAYTPFIEMLRKVMKFADLLRIDHIMGFMRLFWIPSGATPDEGVYVRYPFNDLLRIATLESCRQNCLIVGEDLGTVPNEVRESMNKKGILSYKVFYFEKKSDGTFKSSEEYPPCSMSTTSTHDLPTLVGYWKGRDIEIRAKLNLIPGSNVEKFRIDRESDKKQIIALLKEEALLKDSQPLLRDIIEGILKFIAKTQSNLATVQIEDLLLSDEQPNLPGVVKEYPSWKTRWIKNIEDVPEDKWIMQLAKELTDLRQKAKSQ